MPCDIMLKKNQCDKTSRAGKSIHTFKLEVAMGRGEEVGKGAMTL